MDFPEPSRPSTAISWPGKALLREGALHCGPNHKERPPPRQRQFRHKAVTFELASGPGGLTMKLRSLFWAILMALIPACFLPTIRPLRHQEPRRPHPVAVLK